MSAEKSTFRGGERAVPAMRTFRAFLRLPTATQALALEAVLALLLARLLVGHVPMRYWRHQLDTAPEPSPVREDREDLRRPGAGPEGDPMGGAGKAGRAMEGRSMPAPRGVPRRVARIVRRVAHHVPFRAVCLPQAMAAQWMLRRRGVRSRLVFGARRGMAPERMLEFHAWLIVAGECVIGAGEFETYTPLPPPGTAVRHVNQDDTVIAGLARREAEVPDSRKNTA